MRLCPVFTGLNNVWPIHLDCVVRRGQLVHYKTNILGKDMAKSRVRLLNHSANFASRTSQDAVDGLSDESDGESSTKKKRAPKRGRKKATTDTSGGKGEENQTITEQTAAEETKEVKRRGRKKGKCTYWLHFRSTLVSICCSFHDFFLYWDP